MDIRGYGIWLRAAGYRPDTFTRALRIANTYLTYCSLDGNEPLARGSVAAFLASKAGQVKRVTQLNYWKDLRLFFAYLVSEGLTDANPVEQIPKPRLSLDERERDTRFLPYTDAEFKSLLLVCPHWHWRGLRDRAIFWVLWDTPLRVSEICGLTVDHVKWETLELLVKDGKGGNRYEGLLSENGALALQRYLRARPDEDVDALFCDYHGTGPLSRHGLEQLVRRVAKRAGLKKPCFPHAFRANFRVVCRQDGLDDADISPLMGHKTIVITHSYGRQAAREMAKSRLRQARARRAS